MLLAHTIHIAAMVSAYIARPVAMAVIAIRPVIKFNGRKRMPQCDSPPEKVAGIADGRSE